MLPILRHLMPARCRHRQPLHGSGRQKLPSPQGNQPHVVAAARFDPPCKQKKRKPQMRDRDTIYELHESALLEKRLLIYNLLPSQRR